MAQTKTPPTLLASSLDRVPNDTFSVATSLVTFLSHTSVRLSGNPSLSHRNPYAVKGPSRLSTVLHIEPQHRSTKVFTSECITRKLTVRMLPRSLFVSATHLRQNRRGMVHRCVSATTAVRTRGSVGADDEETEEVLYQNHEPRLQLMRSCLAVSSLHTVYWLWYSLDFVPTVNQSPLPDLHIDPMVPLAGLAAATILQAAAALYPKRLVHKLTYRPGTQQLVLYNYTLPFVRPAPVGKAMPPEQLPLDTSLLDVDLFSFKGHLAIGASWPPYLMHVQKTQDIDDPTRLWQALVEPQRLLATSPRKQASQLPQQKQQQPQFFYKKQGTYRKGRR